MRCITLSLTLPTKYSEGIIVVVIVNLMTPKTHFTIVVKHVEIDVEKREKSYTLIIIICKVGYCFLMFPFNVRNHSSVV